MRQVSILLVLNVVTLGSIATFLGSAANGAENATVVGVPEVPKGLARAVARYGEYRTARFMAWHPDRLEMLVRTRFGNTSQVHCVDKPRGQRTQWTFFPEPVLGVGAWSKKKDREFFTFSMDVGGDEFYQIYAFDTKARQASLLSDGKKRHAGGVYSDVAGLLAYSRVDADAEGALTEILTVDPLDASTNHRVCTMRGGGWRVTDWSPDGKHLLALEYLSINDSRIWEIDVASGDSKRLAPAEDDDRTAAHGAGLYSPTGNGVFFTSDADSEFRQLIQMDSASRRRISSGVTWDVEEAAISPDGKHVAYVTNEGGTSVLRVFDIAANDSAELPRIPVGVIKGIHWHKNNRHLAFSLSSASIPGDVYVVDISSRKLTRWTHSETAVETASFREPELVKWTSFDGRQITGFLYRPPERFKGPRPVMVSIHGGPESQARPSYLGRLNYLLNELGIAIIYPNVRGSRGYGKSFLKLDNGLLREGTHQDIESLLDWIGTRDDLNDQRVMVRGGSYGGYMTLSAAYRFSDRIACAVDLVGISNLRTFLENTQGYRRDLRRAEYGDERIAELRHWMDSTSALENVGKIRKPLLVLQGANDPRVPQSESDQIVAAMKRTGVPVWYVVFADEGHGFRKKSNADYAFYCTVLFTKQFLLAD